MKRIIWMFLLICVSVSAADPGSDVKSHKITFKIKNAGITVDGSFSDLQADIKFDPKDLDKSVLKASVGVASIKTGINKRDRDLQMRKYFYVDKYPRIKITSKKIKHITKDQYKGTFELTIKGVTKDVEIPFTYSEKDNLGTFNGEFTVNRRDFGVGSNSLILSDDAGVFIQVTTRQSKLNDKISSRK